MQKLVNFTTYLKNELAVVYPKLPMPDNPTKLQRIWRFAEQDAIAYFAPSRFIYRAVKTIVRLTSLRLTKRS